MPLLGFDPLRRGLTLLTSATYDPAASGTRSVAAASAMFAPVGGGWLRVTFTAPASGTVVVHINVTCVSGGSSFPTIMLGVLDGATVVVRASPIGGQLGVFASTLYAPQEIVATITGLTPSASYTWDAACASETAIGTTAINWGGPNDTTANNAWGAIQFEIWGEAASAGGTAWTQPVNDTLSLADALAFDRGEALADTVGLADLAATAAVYARTVSDSVTPSDALAFAFDVHLADTLSLADSATPQSGKEALINDTLTLADSVTTTTAYVRTVGDSVTTSGDLLTSSTAYVRQIDDTLSLSDSCTPVKGAGGTDWAQPIADTLTLADSLATTSTYVLGVADTVTLADSLVSSTAYLRSLADTLTLADSLSAALETIVEGFSGEFDADTEHGRLGSSVSDDDFVPVLAGRSRGRASSARYTSTQSGKIGVS